MKSESCVRYLPFDYSGVPQIQYLLKKGFSPETLPQKYT